MSLLTSPEQLSDELLGRKCCLVESDKHRKTKVKRGAFKTDTTQAALIAAKEGLGAALLPVPIGKSEKSSTRLLPNWNGVPVEVCAITSSRKISSAARNFIGLAKEKFNKEK